MNQKLCGGISAVLLTTAFSTSLSCHAQQLQAVQQNSEANYATSMTPVSSESQAQPLEAVKVGEYQSSNANVLSEQTIAKVQSYQLRGSRAATLYVRDIPVLTFIGKSSVNRSEIKVGEVGEGKNPPRVINSAPQDPSNPVGRMNAEADPVWRATMVAAKLNQLSREAVDANNITLNWVASNQPARSGLSQKNASSRAMITASGQASPAIGRSSLINRTTPNQSSWREGDRYLIKVNGEDLVEINSHTRLPDTTNNLAEDALQATNRLRRLMGNAPPLSDIIGKPKPIQTALLPLPQVPLVRVQFNLKGWASWYGPGFHGNRSASGEVYNQNAFTAAHRSLPFGTQVRVTNLSNGLSVIVRINDRGPYVRGRIIDLSAAAARMLGMTYSGVAPVSLNVVDRASSVAIDDQ